MHARSCVYTRARTRVCVCVCFVNRIIRPSLGAKFVMGGIGLRSFEMIFKFPLGMRKDLLGYSRSNDNGS